MLGGRQEKAGTAAEPLNNRIADSRDRLFRVVLAWSGDKMLSDDLVQETIASAISKSYQLRDPAQLDPWLFTILRHCWYRYLRNQKSHIEYSDEYPCDHSGPLGNCAEHEMVERVRHAVASLAIEQREVISLVDLSEMSYCEVAQVLEIPIGTVMSRLHRARKNLLTKLDERKLKKTNPEDNILHTE